MYPRQKSRIILTSVLLMLLSLQLTVRSDISSSSSFIYGKVVDAKTGLPIPHATILIWDLNALEKHIFLTDENGEYTIPDAYLTGGHTYRIYAYKGNFTANTVEYVPSVKIIEYAGAVNVSFSLFPGAMIELKGTPYLVQSSSPGGRILITILDENGSNMAAPFICEYGNSINAWFLNLKKGQVIVPADTPIILEAEIMFFLKQQARLEREIFYLYDGSSPFILPQGGIKSIDLPSYSLGRGLNYVNSKLKEITGLLDEAQRAGFVVFNERRSLADIHQRIIEASTLLARAQNESDYEKVWVILSTALGDMYLISLNLQNMRFVSMTGAVYLSGIMAIFSVVLAFFFFEKNKKKMLSSVIIYILFLIGLYFVYPGTHIVIDENARLFLESAVISFLGVSAIVFGIPRVWKERTVEGEVSWRSAISIIFSMGKRQIRRKKIRGFFTILSIIILILAFTSLTSFGTVYDIVSDKLNAAAPSDGIMVKRSARTATNETSLLFSPLGSEDPKILSEVIKMKNVALRYENIPSSPDPIARLANPKTGKEWMIYGILGITPKNESIYTHLDQIIEEGKYLSEDRDDEILISRSIADDLNVKVNDQVTLDILGAGISSSFIVKGIINNGKYESLIDMDGKSFGPLRILSDGSIRTCNSTEVLIMSWKAAEKLQEMINVKIPEKTMPFAVLSEIVFQLKAGENLDSAVRTLIHAFTYDVYVSSNGIINYYHIGKYVEIKGAAELLVPLVMVGLNVSMVMLNSVYERRKEIKTLSMLGLNPTHIGLIFVAEAIILGMVGGSLGYLFGLGFYRIMVLFGQELMVREKLEWYWSAIGFAIAILASVLSAIRPAALAVSTYTPSKIKRIKLTEKKAEARRKEIFKVYQAKEVSMPVKVQLNEIEFFVGFLYNRLTELKTGYVESVENIEITPEIENVKGELIRSVKFNYRFSISGQTRKTKNSLILIKDPKEDYYRAKLVSEPAVPGMPEDAIDRTIDFVHSIVLEWAKNKERIIGM